LAKTPTTDANNGKINETLEDTTGDRGVGVSASSTNLWQREWGNESKQDTVMAQSGDNKQRSGGLIPKPWRKKGKLMGR